MGVLCGKVKQNPGGKVKQNPDGKMQKQKGKGLESILKGIVGRYICVKDEDEQKQDHFVIINYVKEVNMYQWRNRNNTIWYLIDDGDQNSLKVGQHCPFSKQGYTRAHIIRKNNVIHTIEGPNQEIFTKQPENMYEVLGSYTCMQEPLDNRPDEHYARINLSLQDFTFIWINKTNEFWELKDYGDSNYLSVGNKCSYRQSGYTKMKIARDKNGCVIGVIGQNNLLFIKEDHVKCNKI